MPTRTPNDKQPVEPPPAQAQDEFALASFSSSLRQFEPEPPERVSILSDAELLGQLAQTSDEQRYALSELYTRHGRYVFTVAARTTHTLDREQVADVVTDTLLAASNWARRQPSARAIVARFSPSDREVARRKVLGWLSVIARRIAIEHAQAHAPVQSLEFDVPASSDDSDAGEPPPSPRLRALSEAMSALNPEQRDAIRDSLPWYEPTTHEFAVPRGEAERMASALGISVEVLRQRRHRALKRLHSLLDSMSAE